MDYKPMLIEFVSKELLDVETIAEDEDLLAEGMVDSLGMMRLVTHLEETCGFEIPPEDFLVENFATVAAIDRYLARTRAGQGTA